MTPDDERALFQRLTRIENKISAVVVILIVAAGIAIAHYVADGLKTEYGLSGIWSFFVIMAVYLAVTTYLARMVDKL